MDATKPDVCPFCHTVVAPYDPERRRFLGAFAHGACVEKEFKSGQQASEPSQAPK